MAIFVNYYPCSYGDSLVAMFSGLKIDRVNNLAQAHTHQFKRLDFYNLVAGQQQEILSNLENRIYSCHRQNYFDFGSNHQVISIVLDQIDFLPKRFAAVHRDQMGKSFSNPMLSKLEDRIPYEDLVLADYRSWSKQNILEDDIIFPISLLEQPERLQQFCLKYDLQFDQSKVDEIMQDMNRYR